MASFNIELNSKPVRNTQEYNLLLRVTIDRKHARVKLNYAIHKKDFNPSPKEYKYVRTSNPKHSIINNHISEKIQMVKDIIGDLEKKKLTVSANIVRSKMLKPESMSFLKYASQIATRLKENNHFATYKKYNTVISKITEFRKNEDIQFDEITSNFLDSFEAYLVKSGNGVNTVNSNFRTVRAIYYKAIEKGFVDMNKNPFFTYKLKLSVPVKDRLDQQEIEKIEKLVLKDDLVVENIRNAFLFSFYNAGIRISDILLLKWENIQDTRLVYTMYKTNKIISLKLKDKPLAILEKYKGRGESYIFPFLSDRYDYSDQEFLHKQIGAKTTIINKYLKYIASRAGVTKKVTTHTARHSFANIARQKTDNLYNLSKTLGHSSIKVTEAYLASFDEKAVDDTLDKMF